MQELALRGIRDSPLRQREFDRLCALLAANPVAQQQVLMLLKDEHQRLHSCWSFSCADTALLCNSLLLLLSLVQQRDVLPDMVEQLTAPHGWLRADVQLLCAVEQQAVAGLACKLHAETAGVRSAVVVVSTTWLASCCAFVVCACFWGEGRAGGGCQT